LKQSKKLLFFGLLAGGIIGLVASSPTIYAIVEPHITITMDPGQTTKPFVINDDTSTEVFSINPDGSFSASNVVMLHFEEKGVINVPSGTLKSSPQLLAVWQLVKEPGISDNKVFFSKSILSGQLRSVNGLGSAQFANYISTDGINWTTEGVINAGSSSTTFSPESRLRLNNFLFSDPQFFAFGLHTDADGIGEAKEISGTTTYILPAGHSLVRIL